MSKKGLYIYGIRKVCNYIKKIFTKESIIKYCTIHSLMKPAMAVITINVKKIKAVALFKGDNGVVNYPITYAEVKV